METLSGKEFTQKVAEYLEPLFDVSHELTALYFRNKPELDEAVGQFKRRMVNERMNVIEISKAITELPLSTDPTQIKLLSKQVLDEAKHYDMVRNVIEYLSGEKMTDADIENEIEFQLSPENLKSKGASLFDEIGGREDELMAAIYQFASEGRAHRVWVAMSESIEDAFVSRSYYKIAKDEYFHSQIGRRTLEKLCDHNQEAQDRVWAVLPKMVERMFWIINTPYTPETTEKIEKFYGMELVSKFPEMKKEWHQLVDVLEDWKPEIKGKVKKTETTLHSSTDLKMVDNFVYSN